ncbi:MAG: XRE family transcriptional regulator [Desulfobacteraceae bacterium]|nr:MAG: XRE family transcriptional regulator [Desulfobacteraceae bacterium]
MNKITFGNNVKRIRESDLGLSANKAAQMAFIGVTQLKRIEKGTGNPNLDTILKISEGWGVPIIEFFRESKLTPTKADIQRAGRRLSN